ncbi:MAG: (2Fe-2S)-binding protein [Sphingomonadaceae bacterium]
MRIQTDVERGPAITIRVDGEAVAAFAGETIATAMLAAGRSGFRVDGKGQPRGLYCNMGTCSECLVTLNASGRRVRACLTEARDGMEIATRG